MLEFCVLYKISRITNINICLNNLSLINIISFYATIYFNILIDVFSILLIVFCKFYNSIKLIIDILIIIYINININLKSNNLI